MKINKVIEVSRERRKKKTKLKSKQKNWRKQQKKKRNVNCSVQTARIYAELIVMIIKCPHDLMVNNTTICVHKDKYEMHKKL